VANVDKIIMEAGYGCEIELVVGGTTAIFAGMNEKGEPQVAGEQWVNALRELLDPALEEGRLIAVNKAPILGLGEGWWVPPYFAEAHPELKTVLDIIEHPELFPDSEDPSKGAFIGVAVEGSVLKPLDTWNYAYYKNLVTPFDIISKKTVRNPHANNLRNIVREKSKLRTNKVSY